MDGMSRVFVQQKQTKKTNGIWQTADVFAEEDPSLQPTCLIINFNSLPFNKFG